MLNLSTLTKEVTRYFSKNSTAILTGLGIAGIGATVISTVSATIDAVDKIEKYEEETGTEDISKKEIVQVAWKSYIPTIGIAAATTACFIGAQQINTKRNMALATLYAMTNDSFKEYQEATIAKLGEKKEKEVQDEVSRKRLEEHPVSSSEVIITDGDTLCYDPWSGRYFRSSMEKIRGAVNTVNEDLKSELRMSLNDFYFLLNLPSTKCGDVTGWNIDKPMSVYFSSQIAENDEPCLVLNYHTEPSEDFMEL